MSAGALIAHALFLVLLWAEPLLATDAAGEGGPSGAHPRGPAPVRVSSGTVQDPRPTLPAGGRSTTSPESGPSNAEAPHEAPALAQKRQWALSITPQVFLSRGNSVFSIGAPGGVPNILSELEWNEVDSAIVGLQLEALFARHWLLRGGGFLGVVQGGTFVDSDYLTNDRTNPFSQSIGELDGTALWAVSLDVGYRLVVWKGLARGSQATLDILIGLQSWQEQYRSVNGVQTQDPFGLVGFTGPFPNQGPAVEETFTYHSLRVGVRQRLPLHRYIVLEAEFLFLPWTRFHLTDEHFQRPDLASPAAEVTTTGGFGYQWQAGLSFPLTPRWSLQAMYAMWSVAAGGGDVTIFRSDGTTGIQPLQEGSSTRQGVMLQTSWQF